MTDTAKDWLLQIALSALVSYNRFCIITKIKYKNVRKTYQIVDNVCNVIDGAISTIVASFVYLTHTRIDPFTSCWISVCQYIPHLPATTVDDYSMNFVQDLTTADQYRFQQIYKEAIDRARWNSDENKHAIVIGQICPRSTIVKLIKNDATVSSGIGFTDFSYEVKEGSKSEILRRGASNENGLNPVQGPWYKPSSVRFLEIEYKCGNRAPLTIEIPKSHYITGNELLSKTYILRYLEHLPIYARWTFSESEYSLRVIDDNSEVFSIDSKQYVRLEEDGYKVLDNPYD